MRSMKKTHHLVYARLMQVERLAAPSRERLGEAIARARTLSF